jgi:hypothetical protein
VVVLLASLHVEDRSLEDRRGKRGERFKGEESQHAKQQAKPGRRIGLWVDGGASVSKDI